MFFFAAVKAAKNPDLQLMVGTHTKQWEGDTRHFWLEDANGNIIDPTASQYDKGEYLNGRPISLQKNIDFVKADPLFKTLPESDKDFIENIFNSK